MEPENSLPYLQQPTSGLLSWSSWLKSISCCFTFTYFSPYPPISSNVLYVDITFRLARRISECDSLLFTKYVLMFIGPSIIVIVEEWKTNLMSLAILFHFVCAQHVSDINISIIHSSKINLCLPCVKTVIWVCMHRPDGWMLHLFSTNTATPKLKSRYQMHSIKIFKTGLGECLQQWWL